MEKLRYDFSASQGTMCCKSSTFLVCETSPLCLSNLFKYQLISRSAYDIRGYKSAADIHDQTLRTRMDSSLPFMKHLQENINDFPFL